jgi:P4 family phage/plasmid primase-like protien
MAGRFHARGWSPIPVPYRTKKCLLPGWPKLQLTLDQLDQHFNGKPMNIGVLLGKYSNQLVDVDLDAPEALDVADTFLRPTGAEFGRKSKPRSHRLYTVELKTAKFLDPLKPEDDARAMLVEVRSTGLQTVMPGSTHESGEAIEWDNDGEPSTVKADDLLGDVARLASAALLARYWPGRGSRHDAALALAGGLLRGGWTEDETRYFVEAVANAAGDDEVTDRLAAVSSSAQKLESDQPTTGLPQLANLIDAKVIEKVRGWLKLKKEVVITPADEMYNDTGAALRFVEQWKGQVFHCRERKCWFLYDGCRWRRDTTGAVEQLATKTAMSIFAEIATVNDANKRKALFAFANRTASRFGIVAMLKLAESNRELARTTDHFDRDPWLLNVVNGTIDLRTGQLRPHNAADHITKLAPVVYSPDTVSDILGSYLTQVSGENLEFRAYLQRAAGYSLTGITTEEKAFMLVGGSKTGKTTLTEMMAAALGDYAAAVDAETWLHRRDVGQARPDKARLAGARFVYSSEFEKGRRLDVPSFKALLGGDKITARFLFADEFEFVPQFKAWFAMNEAPAIPDDDDGTWNRIDRLPFTHVIPPEKRDPTVKAFLRDPKRGGPAILAWAVRGCLAWQRKGLGMPAVVESATSELRQSMDPLAGFVADRCITEATASIAVGLLRREYELWCQQSGVAENDMVKGRAWGERLRKHGCTPDRDEDGKRVWRGIRLRDVTDPDETVDGIKSVDGIGPEIRKVYMQNSRDRYLYDNDDKSVNSSESVKTQRTPVVGDFVLCIDSDGSPHSGRWVDDGKRLIPELWPIDDIVPTPDGSDKFALFHKRGDGGKDRYWRLDQCIVMDPSTAEVTA